MPGRAIDFTELGTPEDFEDLVAEILMNLPGILSVEKTGFGRDNGADLIVEVEERDTLTKPRTRTAVVQCKHYAGSQTSVDQSSGIHPRDTLAFFNADIYLLVTSTYPSSYIKALLIEIGKDRKSRGERAACWDATDLESILLKSENLDLLSRFFPVSYRAEMERRSYNVFNTVAQDVLAKAGIALPALPAGPTPSPGGQAMKAYVITSIEYRDVLQESVLREQARLLDIDIEMSGDISTSWLTSFDLSMRHERHLQQADAVFAWIPDEKASRSPNVWIEIEKAAAKRKLRAVFLAQDVYTVTLLSRYPCVTMDSDEASTLERFLVFYRRVHQHWGDQADTWFWFGLALLFSGFHLPLKSAPTPLAAASNGTR